MLGPLDDCGPIARWALTAGTSLGSDVSPDVSLDDWNAEVATLISEGLSPFVARLLPTEVSNSEVGEQLRQAAFRSTAGTMAAVVTARDVLEEFQHEGLEFVVIKGPAVRQWHRYPSQRCFSDIDVVVEPSDFEAALAIAKRIGFEQPAWPGFAWKGFPLEVMESVNLHAANGGNLDVHHHLSPWVFGAHLSPTTIMESAGDCDDASFRFPCSSPETSIVISALHILNDLWKGRLALQSWRDILIMGELLGPDRVEDAFGRYGCSWLLGLLRDSLRDIEPASVVAQSASDAEVPVLMHLRLRALGWGGASVVTTQSVSWAARLPTARALLFLLGSIVPSRHYVQSRDGGYLRYWGRCLRQSMGALRGVDARILDRSDQGAGLRG